MVSYVEWAFGVPSVVRGPWGGCIGVSVEASFRRLAVRLPLLSVEAAAGGLGMSDGFAAGAVVSVGEVDQSMALESSDEESIRPVAAWTEMCVTGRLWPCRSTEGVNFASPNGSLPLSPV